jgi:hypothetical protein
MADPNASTLASDYMTVAVTIPAAASALGTLALSALTAAGYAKPAEILQVTVLPYQSGVATDRSAILFGGSADQLGYLPAGSERTFPVRGNTVYVKRFAAPDVSAVLEIFVRKQE